MPLNIFLSHGTADREWVQRITNDLDDEAMRFYMYENDLQPGRLTAGKLHAAIAACEIVVVLITRHSHKSTYMHQEIGVAIGMGKLVVPLVEKGIPKKSLSMLDGCDFIRFDPQYPEKWIGALSLFLSKHLPEPTIPAAAEVAVPERRPAQTPGLLFATNMPRDEVLTLLLAFALVAVGCYVVFSIARGGGASA